jgi:DNA-binding MarR family transcriptional regulator
LAEILEVEPITVARLVDRLQASGLLERRPDPADRRIWRLHLLPAAGPILDELTEQRASLIAMLTSRVDPAAVAVLTDALLRMRATLSRRPDADAVLAAIEENA